MKRAKIAKSSRSEKEGDVFTIPLSRGLMAFGQVCRGMDHAYFDLTAASIPSIEKIVAHAVIFRVPVAERAIERAGWRIIGNAPLSGSLSDYARYRSQPIGSNQLFVYQAGTLRPASVEEVAGLEALAAWSEHDIANRLQNHFDGKPDPVAEWLNKVRTYDPRTGQTTE